MKILPVLFKGNASVIKLTVPEVKIKFSKFFILKNLKFFKIKDTNKNPSAVIIKIPTIPVSIKISK